MVFVQVDMIGQLHLPEARRSCCGGRRQSIPWSMEEPEDMLRRAYMFVMSCQCRSYLGRCFIIHGVATLTSSDRCRTRPPSTTSTSLLSPTSTAWHASQQAFWSSLSNGTSRAFFLGIYISAPKRDYICSSVSMVAKFDDRRRRRSSPWHAVECGPSEFSDSKLTKLYKVCFCHHKYCPDMLLHFHKQLN